MTGPKKEFGEEAVVFEFEEAVELDERERQATTDIEAGRFVSHEAVMRWVASWGTENELPPPECGD